MVPIKKSDTISKYYILNIKRRVPVYILVLRFLFVYAIPTGVFCLAMILSDIYLFSKVYINGFIFILNLISLSLIATILSHIWFKFISTFIDKEE